MKPQTCLVVLAFLFAQRAQAETTLRWQLQPGDRLSLSVEQQTDSEVSYVGQTTSTQIRVQMALDWQVQSVVGEKITLRQKLERVVFQLQSPRAGKVEYDSAKRIAPTGAAGDVAKALAPLLQAEMLLTMSARGEVLSAEPANDAAKELLAPAAEPAPVGQNAANGAAAAQSPAKLLEQLLRQPLVVLPEAPVNSGDTWKHEREFDSALGKATQTTTYTYAGSEEQEGQSLEKITSAGTLDVAAGASKPTITLKSHEQAATYLFDATAGRLVSADATQSMATERPYRDTVITVTLKTTQKTKLTPAESKE